MKKDFMNFISKGVLIALASASLGQSPPAQPQDEDRLYKVERLVVNIHSDVAGREPSPEELKVLVAETQRRNQARIQRIRNEAGLAPYLVALADLYFEQKGNGLAMIMEAISQRSDIPAADIERFVKHAAELAESPKLASEPISIDFLTGTASILAKYPSSTNEDILIRMLGAIDDFRGVPLKIAAGRALSTSGTEKSLKAVQAASQWMTRNAEGVQNETRTFEANDLKGYQAALEARVASLRKAPHSAH